MPNLWDWLPKGLGAIEGPAQKIRWADLADHTSLGCALESWRGRSVLVAARDPLAAALALVELDGVARRMVLCTPDLTYAQLQGVARDAEADAIAGDSEAQLQPWRAAGWQAQGVETRLTEMQAPRRATQATEWVLLTSGTSGAPKLVSHTLTSLAGGLPRAAQGARPVVWSTFYDIRRYGGLQIFLRAVLSGSVLVLAQDGEPAADYFERAAAAGVSHVSGTPSHWRRALMSGLAGRIAPAYVRLSGEIANQSLLDQLAAAYPQAQVSHAYASTEAGVAFAVDDGGAGFPARLLDSAGPGPRMKIEDGTLRIRSERAATAYLGAQAAPIADAAGYVDTGDRIELREGRCHFVGRRGGVINVGGMKVHPEEVEAVLNGDTRVRMSLVHARSNPIVGAVVVAAVVLDGERRSEAQVADVRSELMQRCRACLPPHKVPAMLRFVPALDVSAAGKLVRNLG